MTSAVFGAAGSKIGSLAAGTFGWTAATWSQIGWTTGVLASTYLFAPDGPDITNEGSKLDDLKVTTSVYGSSIPKVYGAYRISGNIIWALPLQETRHEERQEEGKGGGGSSETNIWYTYAGTWAIALCEGPIGGVRKIWFDSKLVYDNGSSALLNNITIYNGTSTQAIDWRIQSDKPDTPAYRNVAYVVFNDVQLEDHGNRIPNVTCEVVKNGAYSSKYISYVSGVDNTTKSYLPPEFYGYDAGHPINNILDDNSFYHIMLQNTLTGEGPNIYLVRMDTELNHIKTILVATGVANIQLPNQAITDDGSIIYSSNVINSSVWVYDDDGTTSFNISHLSSEIRSNLQDVATIMKCGNNVFIYDDDFIATKAVPIYQYVSGVCVSGDCNVLHEFISADSLSDIRPTVMYCADGMIFTPSNTTYTLTATTKMKIFSGHHHNTLLYEFDLLRDYDSTAFVCMMFYQKESGYLYVTQHYANSVFKNIDIFQITTGALIRTIVIEVPAENSSVAATKFEIKGNKAYYYGHYDVMIVNLDSITDNGIDLRTCCEEIALSAGYPLTDLDFTAGTDLVTGYVIKRNEPARTSIEVLLSAYEYSLVETNNKLVLRKQDQTSLLTVNQEDLGANTDNKFEQNTKQDLDLIRSLTIRYANSKSDYQTSVQMVMRTDVNAKTEQTVELPLALTDTQGKRLAEKMLYRSWLMRQSFKLTLPFTSYDGLINYKLIISGDIITVTLDGLSKEIRVTKITTTEDNKLQIEGIAHDYETFISEAIGSDTGSNAAVLSEEVSNTTLHIANTPTLDNTYIDSEGLFVIATGNTDTWDGCTVYSQTDSVSELVGDVVILNRSLIGQTYGVLADASINVWDRVNTIDVSVLTGDLFSITEEQVLNGGNYALIGNEIIQYATATLISNNKYELSNLLRGRMCTEQYTGIHSFGDIFIDMGFASFIPKTINNNDIYHSISLGSSNLVEYGNVLYNGENLKPFKVEYLRAYRIADTSIMVKWMRRSRYLSGYMKTLPVAESVEQYNVDVLVNDALINSYTVTTPVFEYTSALATTDSIEIKGIIKFRISQTSSVYGQGYENEVDIAPYITVTYHDGMINLTPHLYWRFIEASGDPLDYSINSYTGTKTGTVTQGEPYPIPGTGFTSYRLSSGYVESATAGGMDYSNYSYCFFYNLHGNDSAEFMLTKGGLSNDYDCGVYNSSAVSYDMPVIAAYHKQAADNVAKIVQFNGNQIHQLDEWHHVAVTYDGTTLKTYMDGLFQAELAVSALKDQGDVVRANSWGTSTTMDCSMSEVSILPTALTLTQIADLVIKSELFIYNTGTHSSYINSLTTAPVNYYLFNDASGAIVDETGNQDGTLGVDGTYAHKSHLLRGDPSVSRYFTDSTSLNVVVDINTVFQNTISSTFSVTMRVQPYRHFNITAATKILIGSWNNTTGIYLAIDDNMQISFRMANVLTTDDLFIKSTNAIKDSAVHTLTLTYDGTGTSAGTKIYINGAVETNVITYNNLVTTPTYPNNTFLGAGTGAITDANKAKSTLSNLAVFDYVLSATEASDLHDTAIAVDI